MRTRLALAALALFLLPAAARADEVTLTFDRPPGEFTRVGDYSVYRESGFQILRPAGRGRYDSQIQGRLFLIADTQTNLTLEMASGGVFDLLSFDAFSIDAPGLIVTASNGAVFIPTTSFLLSGTYLLPDTFRGVSWVTFAITRPDLTTGFIPGVGLFPVTAIIEFDNFRLQPDPTPTPEPATLLLLSTGLAGVFGAARRRHKKN